MTKTASKIRFRAKLFRPAASAKVGSWTFLTLPKDASAKLPARGMTTVEGTINGFPFRATLEPDGGYAARVSRSVWSGSRLLALWSGAGIRQRQQVAALHTLARGSDGHPVGQSPNCRESGMNWPQLEKKSHSFCCIHE